MSKETNGNSAIVNRSDERGSSGWKVGILSMIKRLMGMKYGSGLPDHPDVSHVQRKNGLSQYDLMKRKFFRHKAAVTSLLTLIIIYFVILFAEFFGPYEITARQRAYVHAPPMRIRVLHNGRLQRPFVYQLEQALDPATFRRTFSLVTDNPVPIRLFVRGAPYRLLGLFQTNTRLFGVEGEGNVVYLLGADRFGRDLFSRTLSGARVSLTAGFLGVTISVILGSVLGTASGYFGGRTDMVIQRVIEFISSFPNIPLWLTLSAALPPQWSSIMVYFGIVTILGFIGWAGIGREVRGKVMSMSQLDFIQASKASGGSHWWAISRHLIPNALSHIIVMATLAVPAMILGEAALSFLGLGIRPPMTSLGVLLQESQNIRSIAQHPWLFTPGIVIIVSILAFNFLGDGLRDAADPYSA